MAIYSVTLSSSGIPGNTRAFNLDWMKGPPVGVSITGSSSGTFAYTVQYTLDDIMNVAATSVSWIADPSATALTSNSSGIYVYTQPITAIRLSASAASSCILTFKVVQGSW